MTKYKRIIEEDENGNQKVIDVIKSTETIKVIPKKDPKQLAIANQKNELKTHCKNLGGYVHIRYIKNELLFNELNLKLPTIARLVYLATFIDYNNREENVLIKHGQHQKIEYLTRKDLGYLLNLTDTPLRDFLKEAEANNLIYHVNKKYYLSTEYFSKGECHFNKNEYARIFIDTTRLLYQNSKPTQHRQLAYIYQLIPYLHYDSNVLCKNPEETNIKLLQRLTLKEICKILGLGSSSKSLDNLKKKLLSFHIEKDGAEYYLFTRIKLEKHTGQTDFFVVNPNVIWKGSDLDLKKEIISKLLIF